MTKNLPYAQLSYPKYNRIKKKFPSLLIGLINKAEDEVVTKPGVGVEKKGDLKGVYVYKFDALDQLLLLAYEINHKDKEVIFVAIGGHENFYRDLKAYLK